MAPVTDAAETGNGPKPRQPASRIRVVLGILLFLVALPIIICGLLVYAFCAALLHLIVWLYRRPYVLFVYSESPLWQPYIEQHILPKLPRQATVLNWSQRRHWKSWWLSSLCFGLFAGQREFNPLAIVVRPFRRRRTFRFFQAFRDFKHGSRAALAQVEAEFFGYLKRSGDRHAELSGKRPDG